MPRQIRQLAAGRASRLRTSAFAAVALALCVAAPAGAATIEKVRVGQHPSFTRVVFELDAPTGYRLEKRVGPDGTPLVVVTLDAGLSSAVPRRVRSGSSLLSQVKLEQPVDRTVATIRLKGEERPVKEMILGSPPRIVLDVLGEDAALASRAAPKKKKTAASKPAPKPQASKPAPKPEVARTPAPKPQASPPAPKPKPQVAKPVPPKPEPKPLAQAPKPALPVKPAAKPEPPVRAKPLPPKPKPLAQAPKPEPKPLAQAPKPALPVKPAAEKTPATQVPPPKRLADAAPKSAQDAETEEAREAREAMERRLAAVREAAERRKAEAEAKQNEKTAKADSATTQVRTAQTDDAGDGPNWLLFAGIGGAVVALVGGVVFFMRRRALPRDLDVASIGDGADDEPFDLGADAAEEQADALPNFEETSVEAHQPPLSAPGLLDEPEKGETAMDTTLTEMPTQQNISAPRAGGGDVSALIAEMERRMTQLESRLDEANAARERLERQVAAQSEELRVQRAAIARTQRALRGLSRSDQEQATEPALRE